MTSRIRARSAMFLAAGAVSGALFASLLAASTAPAVPAAVPAPAPLAGLVIALDPGHQLGNSNPAFADEMAQSRFNGYETKACNTTGTATASGFAESTFIWRVARYLKVRLRQLGAKVKMTRDGDSYRKWGPCVWDRGEFGAE
ncbi:MAG: N-acetylmuramoyl-L-alanine amidase, partial [bacterium]